MTVRLAASQSFNKNEIRTMCVILNHALQSDLQTVQRLIRTEEGTRLYKKFMAMRDRVAELEKNGLEQGQPSPAEDQPDAASSV